jgi:hypothetical protein
MAFTEVKSQNHRSPPAGTTKARDDNGTDGRSQAFDAVLRKRRNLAQRATARQPARLRHNDLSDPGHGHQN